MAAVCSSCGAGPVSGKFCSECDAPRTPQHPGQQPDAERALATAKLTAKRDPVAANGEFANAIEALRATGSRMHLGHALLDEAELAESSPERRAELIAEAELIAADLGCMPIRDRIEALRAVSPAG